MTSPDVMHLLPPFASSGIGAILPLVISDFPIQWKEGKGSLSLLLCVALIWFVYIIDLKVLSPLFLYSDYLTISLLGIVILSSLIMFWVRSETKPFFALYVLSLAALTSAGVNYFALSDKYLVVFDKNITEVSYYTNNVRKEVGTSESLFGNYIVVDNSDIDKINSIYIFSSDKRRLKISESQLANKEKRGMGYVWNGEAASY